MISDKRIDIYSGVERFFNSPWQLDTAHVDLTDTVGEIWMPKGVMWQIKDSSDIITVIELDELEYCMAYPFTSLPEKLTPVLKKRWKD
jgi:hypothetical protein